jgi:PAS domain S-box-containing protein
MKKDRQNLFVRFRAFFWLFAGAWTVCIAASLLWNLREQSNHSLQMARLTAQITFENDVLYRRWSAKQGGVYVRVSGHTPPNPYLRVPDRDVFTTSGLSLTLVNPAYMARQVNDMAGAAGSRGHLTSLKPLRPENTPDAWESAALRSFEKGVTEVGSVENLAGGEHLRLMRPFVIEKNCLKCHAFQGYKVGDIRGGISVSVPMAPLRAIERPMTVKLALGHLGLWLIGLTGLGIFRWNLGQEVTAREQADEQLRRLNAELEQQVREQTAEIRQVNATLEQRVAERTDELRESEGKYRNLFENMAEEVHFWEIVRDEAGDIKTWRLLDANPPTLKTWGLAAIEDIRGKTTDEIFGPGATEHFMPVVRKIMTEAVAYSFEDYFPHLGRHFRFTTVPLGEYFITTGADITGIKKAQEALWNSERRYRTFIELTSQFAWVTDAAGQVVEDIPALRGFTGQTYEQAKGAGWSAALHPDDLQRTLDVWNCAVSTKSQYEIEYRMRRHDDVYRLLLARGVPIHNEQGDVVEWVGTCIDITERKEAEQALRKAHDELTKLVDERTRELREKELLLKEVHHRVKNNLQVISSLVGLQADGSRDETVRTGLRDVTDRVRSMALVHERLYQSADLARIDFAEYTRSLLNYLWRAHGTAAVRLTLDLDPITLPVDTAVPCGLILNELAGNALKHAFKGRSEGEVTVSLHADGDGRIRMCVRDNGVGLPAGIDWRQANSLGLRLVQMLGRQLDAAVEVRTGEGTEFEIVI